MLDYFTDVLGLLDSLDGLLAVVQLKNDETHRIFPPILVHPEPPNSPHWNARNTWGQENEGVKLVFW